MTAMATLADCKAYAGVSSPNADPIMQSILDASALAFASYCNKDSFFSTTYTEYRDGTGGNRMILGNTPMTAVSAVVIDGQSIPASVGNGPGYFFPMGGRMVGLRGYVFNAGFRNVQITYTAGFNDPNNLFPLPADLIMATKMYVSYRYRERERLGISAKSLAGESVTYSGESAGGNSTLGTISGMPAAAANILENYMNMVPESGV